MSQLFQNWNFRRLLFLALGLFILVEAAIDRQWMSMIPGAWFVLMALFSLGCASGNCAVESGRQIGRKRL